MCRLFAVIQLVSFSPIVDTKDEEEEEEDVDRRIYQTMYMKFKKQKSVGREGEEREKKVRKETRDGSCLEKVKSQDLGEGRLKPDRFSVGR